jgi:hypothetical protein
LSAPVAPTITIFKGNSPPHGGDLPLNIFVQELKYEDKFKYSFCVRPWAHTKTIFKDNLPPCGGKLSLNIFVRVLIGFWGKKTFLEFRKKRPCHSLSIIKTVQIINHEP